MKKQILSLAVMLCLFSKEIHAQNNNSAIIYQDTIIMHVNQNIKIFFIGQDLQEMFKYKKVDSLKTLFVADLTKAVQNETFPTDSKVMHYFVHASGKRRLKAENVEYQDAFLDVEKEIQAIKLNLPAYTYIIHDIETGYLLQVYSNDPNTIKELENVNLNDAINLLASDKKRQRKSYSIALQFEDAKWLKLPPHLKKDVLFETDPTIGFGVIGSQLTPELGLEIAYVFTNKYFGPRAKIGLSARNYLFSDYNNKEFFNFYAVNSFNINFKVNLPRSKSTRGSWFGIELGALDADGGFLDNNYKFGFIYGYESFQVGFDFISPDWGLKNTGDDLLYGFTVRFSL